MSDFEKSEEEFSSKEKFYSSLTGKKISDKKYEGFFKVSNKSEMKRMRDYRDYYVRVIIGTYHF